jgi:hypothetical protein
MELSERRSEVHPPGLAGRLRQVLIFGAMDREAPLLALAGFLVRGGIVFLAAPALVFPSVIEIANLILLKFVAIDGQPMALVYQSAVVAVIAILAWLALAGLVGALVDIWLVRMALDGHIGSRRGKLELPKKSQVVRIAGIRLACLVPLAVSIVVAAVLVVATTYDELIAPSSAATPVANRVFLDSLGPAALVIVVWLASESIAAIAVRRHILTGTGIWRSLADAVGQAVRRPISTLATVLVSYIASFAAVGVSMLATYTAFDWCRVAARNAEPIAVTLGLGAFSTTRDFRPVVFTLAAISMAGAWALALALCGISSAWRSAAFTREVTAALGSSGRPAGGNRLGLSGQGRDTTGD